LGVGLGFGFFGFLGFGCWVGFWVFWVFRVWVLGWVKNPKPNPKTQFFLGAGDWSQNRGKITKFSIRKLENEFILISLKTKL
jgi:dipeptide/tripeptide permease